MSLSGPEFCVYECIRLVTGMIILFSRAGVNMWEMGCGLMMCF